MPDSSIRQDKCPVVAHRLHHGPTPGKVAKLKSFDASRFGRGCADMSVAVAQPSHNLPDPITLNDLAALADGDETTATSSPPMESLRS